MYRYEHLMLVASIKVRSKCTSTMLELLVLWAARTQNIERWRVIANASVYQGGVPLRVKTSDKASARSPKLTKLVVVL